MPGSIHDSIPSISSGENTFEGDGRETTIVSDEAYSGMKFDGQNELPLSEQLEPIAVVGMGCRLPGDVKSPADFWKLMIEKGSGRMEKVPPSRFNIDAYLHSDNERPGSFNVPGGYFIDSDLQDFDPTLFNISPIEAMWMDPQQRLLLQVCYESFESGGITLDRISNTKTAVFVGSFTSDFQQMSFKEPDFRNAYAATGVDPGIISNRISHVFNLHGPSITVNTACSSSVYAIHNACNALRNGECSGAIVGGTNLVLTVDQHMNTAKLGVLSPTSTCHTFDESADGYGRADAVGAVYLKRLSDAIRDGDPIRGLIRSSAVNSNGKVPAVGITHPNLEGQEEVIRHAYKRGGNLDPRMTGYFEVHGTGTPVGDPLEVHAVSKAMNTARKPSDEPLLIGAVKTNIGHSEAASGLSALIKAVLIVETGIIPPTRGVVKLNPKIAWDDWKVRVVTEPTPLPSHLPVRRVSVNSFGYGGTNAHMIIEGVQSILQSYQSPAAARKLKLRGNHERHRPFLIPFSAHDRNTLNGNIEATSQVHHKYNLLDLSYTLSMRRSQFSSRGFAVMNGISAANDFDSWKTTFSLADKKKTPVLGFVFTGQGAQWARMGAELMDYYPRFLIMIRKLDRTLGDLDDSPFWTIEDSLLEDAQRSRVNEAEFSQPLCTAIQICLVDLLASWGIKPVVTVGHSSGEIGAAYASGLISASEAIVAAYYRGKVVRNLTDGAMLAVGLGAVAVQQYIEEFGKTLVVACHNSPNSATISGDKDSIGALEAKLTKENIFARSVKTNGKAYHSHHMTSVSGEYERCLQSAEEATLFDTPLDTQAVMVSSVTMAKLNPGTKLNHAYWSQNLVSPVRFDEAVQLIANDEGLSVDLLVEIGPHSALSGPIRQICASDTVKGLDYLPSLVRGKDSAIQILKLVGELWLRNTTFDLERVVSTEVITQKGTIDYIKGSTLVDLPPYQWNYVRKLWAEPRQSVEHRAPKQGRHDLLGRRVPGGAAAHPSWRNVLRIRDIPWLQHHFLGNEAVFPAAGYFSMAIEAITQINEEILKNSQVHSYVLRDVSIKAALVTPDNDEGIEVIFSMLPSVSGSGGLQSTWWDFNVSSVSQEGQWNDHMTGTISINTQSAPPRPTNVPNLPQVVRGRSWNQALKEVGFDYGTSFADMENVRSNGKDYVAAAETTIKNHSGIMQDESRHVLHPSTVDSCLQLIIVSIYAGKIKDMTCGAVPVQVDEVAIFPPATQHLDTVADAYSWTTERGVRSFRSGSELVTRDGTVLMRIKDMRCVAYEAAVPQQLQEPVQSQTYGNLVWKPDFGSPPKEPLPAHTYLVSLVESFVHKYPDAKILEFGTSCIYGEALNKNSLANYTVVSTTEVDEETQRSAQQYKNLRFLKTDIADPYQTEGLALGSFDLIVSVPMPAQVGHLNYQQSLLVPGGWAVLQATSEQVLEESGFLGKHIFQNGCVLAQTSTLQDVKNLIEISKKARLIYKNSPHSLVAALQQEMELHQWKVQVSTLETLTLEPEEHAIILADLEGPLLASLKAPELSALQHIISTASKILWITSGNLTQAENPEHAMVSGLTRSIRSENASLDLVIADLDLASTSLQDATEIIATLANKQILGDQTLELEYCIKDALPHISRLLPVIPINEEIGTTKEIQHRPFDQVGDLIGKVIKGQVIFTEDPLDRISLSPDNVEIRVELAGLSSEGVAVMAGTDFPGTFSHEIYGEVLRLGSNVTHLHEGDKVVGYFPHKYATIQQVPARLTQKLEPEESPEEFLTLPMAYASAIHGLVNLANTQPGEVVLVLGSTGASGAAAIRICQMIKSDVFVIVDNKAEAERVVSSFSLNRDQVIENSRSLSSKITGLNGGKGPDVVFSANSNSDTSREAWRGIAPFGRFLDGGRKRGMTRQSFDAVPLHRGATYHSFDLLEMFEAKQSILAKLLELTIHFHRQKFVPSFAPIQSFHIAEINDAVSQFSDSITSGKSIVSFDKSAAEIRVLPTLPSVQFRPDATYLLVGALGGLGRSVGYWMIEHGAKHFAFLSRSGIDAVSAKTLVESMRERGATVDVIRGDATNISDVERALKSISPEHPLKGVIHAAMVLRDGMFHSMTIDNWKTSISPKLDGARNLHNALGDTELDFFVTTSSTSGTLGTPGQSNYAAANNYLDSLARHRVRQGKPSISLVLPMVLGVGYVAEHPEIEEALKRKGIYGIDEEHLLQSFGVAMGPHANSTTGADHIIVGMDPAELKRSINGPEVTDGFWIKDPRFRAILHTVKSGSSEGEAASGSGKSIVDAIQACSAPIDALAMVRTHMVEKLSRLLHRETEEFDNVGSSIADFGVDSMIGAELRNWVYREYAIDIAFQQLLGATFTVDKFSETVCRHYGLVE